MSVPRVSLVGGTSSRHSDETIIEVKVRSMQGKDEATIADEMGINVTSVRRFLGRVKADPRRSREALLKSREHDLMLQQVAEDRWIALGGTPPPYNPIAWANLRSKSSSSRKPNRGNDAASGSSDRRAGGSGGGYTDSDLEQGSGPPSKRSKKGTGSGGNGQSGGSGSTFGASTSLSVYGSRSRPARRFFQAVEVPNYIRLALSPALQPPVSRGSSPTSMTSADTALVAVGPSTDTREGSAAVANAAVPGQSPPRGSKDDPDGSENGQSAADEPGGTIIRDIGGTPEAEDGLNDSVSMDVKEPGLDLAAALASGAIEMDALHRREAALLSREEIEAEVRARMAAEPVVSAVRGSALDEDDLIN